MKQSTLAYIVAYIAFTVLYSYSQFYYYTLCRQSFFHLMFYRDSRICILLDHYNTIYEQSGLVKLLKWTPSR
jgi:hypothetical protein